MFSLSTRLRPTLLTTCLRANSTQVQKQQLTDAERHATEHMGIQMHPKFYEKEVKSTSIKELEFVRHPFYDMAKFYQL